MITVYRLIDFLFWLLNLANVLRALFSWINPDPYNAIVRLVHQSTEPILAPLRRYIPPVAGMDITPIVAIVFLELLHRILIALIF